MGTQGDPDQADDQRRGQGRKRSHPDGVPGDRPGHPWLLIGADQPLVDVPPYSLYGVAPLRSYLTAYEVLLIPSTRGSGPTVIGEHTLGGPGSPEAASEQNTRAQPD